MASVGVAWRRSSVADDQGGGEDRPRRRPAKSRPPDDRGPSPDRARAVVGPASRDSRDRAVAHGATPDQDRDAQGRSALEGAGGLIVLATMIARRGAVSASDPVPTLTLVALSRV